MPTGRSGKTQVHSVTRYFFPASVPGISARCGGFAAAATEASVGGAGAGSGESERMPEVFEVTQVERQAQVRGWREG